MEAEAAMKSFGFEPGGEHAVGLAICSNLFHLALAQVILPGSPLWKRRTVAPPAMVVTSSGTTGMPGPSDAWRLQSIVGISTLHPQEHCTELRNKSWAGRWRVHLRPGPSTRAGWRGSYSDNMEFAPVFRVRVPVTGSVLQGGFSA